MREHTYIPALMVLMLAFVSCESIIEFKGEGVTPKIVIYSLLEPDSLVTVSVAVSHAVFDDRYEPEQITDAVVRLYRDSEMLETLTYVPEEPLSDDASANPYSRYVSQVNKPQYGSSYKIEVEVPGFTTAYGEASLPDPVPIVGIDTAQVIIDWRDWVERRLTVRVRFHDPAGQDNYYRVTAGSLIGFYIGSKELPYTPLQPVVVEEMDISYAFYEEPLIAPKQDDDIFGMYLQNTYNLFTDELISGKEYELTMETHFSLPDTDYYEFAHASIRLHTITRDLYLYLQSYAAHTQTRDNFLSEPVMVYTNVTDGLGVVGAVSTSVIALKIGEYPVDGVNYDYQNMLKK